MPRGSCSGSGLAHRFEDAETGDKYARYDGIPFGRVHELFAYQDPQAENAWDADRPDSPPNSMVYLILSSEFVTAVVDDPDAIEMRQMLESIREMMCERILVPDIDKIYAEVA